MNGLQDEAAASFEYLGLEALMLDADNIDFLKNPNDLNAIMDKVEAKIHDLKFNKCEYETVRGLSFCWPFLAYAGFH